MLLQGRRCYVGRSVRIRPAVGAGKPLGGETLHRECVFAGLRGNSTPSAYLRALPNARILTDIRGLLGPGAVGTQSAGPSGLIPMDERLIEAQMVDTQYFIA